jgi:hypothetical protein
LEKRKNLHSPHNDLHPFTVAADKLLYPDLSISCAKSAYLYDGMLIFLFFPLKSCRIIVLVSFLLRKTVGP